MGESPGGILPCSHIGSQCITSWDRSSPRACAPSKSAKVIQSFIEEFAVTDIWRFCNTSKREYSFFSQVHLTFTRNDYFLVDNRLLSSVSNCAYDAIVISDHAPIIMNICFKNFTSMHAPWHLNTHLLLNDNFVNFVSQQVDFFVSLSKTPDVSASVLWEALKAYIRGEIISYTGYEKKLRREKLTRLTQRISELDRLYATHKTPELYNSASVYRQNSML